MLKLLPAREASGASWLRLSALWLAFVLAGGTALFGAITYPANSVDLATGLTGAVGVAFDEASSQLYFVDYNAGELRRLALVPGCWTSGSTPPCGGALTVTSGLAHPEDVALDVDAGVGYVTTRDDVGTTGALWRVDLATGTKHLVTFNLGAPHQIVLDLRDALNKRAYVVGYDSGTLWRIDLASGVKVPVVSALDHPTGLAVTADFTRGYVTEQGATQALAAVDLGLGARLGTVAGGLTAPFYLQWTDSAETFLYLVERDPADQVLLVDLVTAAPAPVITSLPARPSGIAVSLATGAAFVTTDGKVVRVELAALPVTEPVFIGVGRVPSTRICQGYATTNPGDPLQYKHAPFGGTLDILGNFIHFKSLSMSVGGQLLSPTHYRVLVSTDGGTTFNPLAVSWNAERWVPAESEYQWTPVAPLPGDSRYEIPPEYPAAPHRWKPPFLMLQWRSEAPGLHTFKVELWNLNGTTWTDLTSLLPAAQPCVPATPTTPKQPPTGNGMTLMIDNEPPDIDLVSIRLHQTGATILPCQIVEDADGCNGYDFVVTAHDPSHHMWRYWLEALWGHNQSDSFFSDLYSPAHENAEGPYLWSGVSNRLVSPGSTGWQAQANCAHTFILWGAKRTIDGYQYILRRRSHQSVTINNVGNPCP